MHATERVTALRREFSKSIQHEDVTRFKFMNETSLNLTYTRRYGRAAGGQHVGAAVTLHNGPNVALVAALSAQGVEAVMEQDGALNTASFAVYLEQVLGPSLQPGDVLVLDNLPVHKAAGLTQPSAGKAAYCLLDHPQATPEAFQQPHRHLIG